MHVAHSHQPMKMPQLQLWKHNTTSVSILTQAPRRVSWRGITSLAEGACLSRRSPALDAILRMAKTTSTLRMGSVCITQAYGHIIEILLTTTICSTAIVTQILSNFMVLSPPCEAASCANTQKFPNILRNLKTRYRVQKDLPLVPILTHKNPVHNTPY
jgi:hypothetical protein